MCSPSGETVVDSSCYVLTYFMVTKEPPGRQELGAEAEELHTHTHFKIRLFVVVRFKNWNRNIIV